MALLLLHNLVEFKVDGEGENEGYDDERCCAHHLISRLSGSQFHETSPVIKVEQPDFVLYAGLK